MSFKSFTAVVSESVLIPQLKTLIIYSVKNNKQPGILSKISLSTEDKGMKGKIKGFLLHSPEFCLALLSGVGYLCGQPGHQPGHRSLPVCGLWGHVSGDLGHSHRLARHLLHPGGRTRVAAGEDEAGIVGSAHLLGAGGPLRCE